MMTSGGTESTCEEHDDFAEAPHLRRLTGRNRQMNAMIHANDTPAYAHSFSSG